MTGQEDKRKDYLASKKNGKLQIGPSSIKEFKKDMLDLVIFLLPFWIPALIIGALIGWKFRSVLLAKFGNL